MVRVKLTEMSCGYCVQRIRSEIGTVAPGAPISVDLATGEVDAHAATEPRLSLPLSGPRASTSCGGSNRGPRDARWITDRGGLARPNAGRDPVAGHCGIRRPACADALSRSC